MNEQSEQEWAQRLAKLRETEWRLSVELLELGGQMLRAAQERLDMGKATLPIAIGLFEDGSKFGRKAIEGIEEPPKGADPVAEFNREMSERLKAIYGEEADAL